eukprot:RCo038881
MLVKGLKGTDGAGHTGIGKSRDHHHIAGPIVDLCEELLQVSFSVARLRGRGVPHGLCGALRWEGGPAHVKHDVVAVAHQLILEMPLLQLQLHVGHPGYPMRDLAEKQLGVHVEFLLGLHRLGNAGLQLRQAGPWGGPEELHRGVERLQQGKVLDIPDKDVSSLGLQRLRSVLQDLHQVLHRGEELRHPIQNHHVKQRGATAALRGHGEGLMGAPLGHSHVAPLQALHLPRHVADSFSGDVRAVVGIALRGQPEQQQARPAAQLQHVPRPQRSDVLHGVPHPLQDGLHRHVLPRVGVVPSPEVKQRVLIRGVLLVGLVPHVLPKLHRGGTGVVGLLFSLQLHVGRKLRVPLCRGEHSHRRLPHQRVLVQYRFDATKLNPKPTHLDLAVGAAQEDQVAPGAVPGQVPGAVQHRGKGGAGEGVEQPRELVQGHEALRGEGGVGEVAQAHAGAADVQLPTASRVRDGVQRGVHQEDLGVVNRPPDGGKQGVGLLPTVWRLVHHQRGTHVGLRRAVVVVQRGQHPIALQQPLEQRRQRGRHLELLPGGDDLGQGVGKPRQSLGGVGQGL